MATRIKKPAAVTAIPQSKSECAAKIKELGDVQREFERARGEMNDAIAGITKSFAPVLEPLTAQIMALQTGIQTWAESNRVALLGEGDKLGKTAQLVTGTVSWRMRPPSVSIRGADSVIDTLSRMGLERFIRSKFEPNKEAMLNDPEAVRGIAGITLVTGVEDFVIVPFEVQVEAV